MKIEVRESNVPLSEALEAHISRKLDGALRHLAARIDLVVVRLIDLNGPKGGLDKRCRLAARLSAPAPSIIVEATHADAYVAVSQAIFRLEERLTRLVTRRRQGARLRLVTNPS